MGFRISFDALLVVACLLTQTAAHGQEVSYTVQPGDNPWRIALQHLKPGMLNALVEHNGITNPLRIAPGTTLRIPKDWLFRGSRPVSVIDVSGQAVSVSGRGTEKELQAGDRIPAQSRIRTREQGSVTLQFSDGSRVLVGEKSDVRLQKNSFVPLAEGRDIRLNVPTGKVENEARNQEKPNGRFEIRTPSGVAAVRGTRFRLTSAARDTRTEVLEGKVAVSDKRGTTIPVPAGYGMALQNGRSVASQPLLKAPSVGPGTMTVEQLPIDLPMQPVAGAVAYRTLVSSPGTLTAILSDQKTTAAAMRIRDVPDGDYQLRVRAIDQNGLEGEETQRPLSINARPGAPFLISPTADAGISTPRPGFSWARNTAASSYHFQLATNPGFQPVLIDAPNLTEPSFQPDAELPEGGYFWRLAAVSSSEGRGPFSPAESFRRTPATPGMVSFNNEQQAVRWQKLADARYQVQVADNPGMEKPVIDRMLEDNQLVLQELSAGTYFVRVQTLGASGLRSQWSDTQSFHVTSGFKWEYLLLPLPLLLLL
ncbi:MAG: FecR domain-containing protein [Dechloromonas sp.]|nr:FecR domain-containing protein [Dechloromonas sp.]